MCLCQNPGSQAWGQNTCPGKQKGEWPDVQEKLSVTETLKIFTMIFVSSLTPVADSTHCDKMCSFPKEWQRHRCCRENPEKQNQPAGALSSLITAMHRWHVPDKHISIQIWVNISWMNIRIAHPLPLNRFLTIRKTASNWSVPLGANNTRCLAASGIAFHLLVFAVFCFPFDLHSRFSCW